MTHFFHEQKKKEAQKIHSPSFFVRRRRVQFLLYPSLRRRGDRSSPSIPRRAHPFNLGFLLLPSLHGGHGRVNTSWANIEGEEGKGYPRQPKPAAAAAALGTPRKGIFPQEGPGIRQFHTFEKTFFKYLDLQEGI